MTGQHVAPQTTTAESAERCLHRLKHSLRWTSESLILPDELRPLATLALAECDAALVPGAKEDFQRHLTTCLMLVAPVGMGEAERREWLRVAWGTVRHLPADLLAIGATAARQEADHPSKIVPIIIRATEAAMTERRAERAKVAGLLAKRERMPWEEDDTPFDPATKPTAEQMAKARADFGLKTTEPERRMVFDTPARTPTREDYIALGVDPATLDSLFPLATAA